MIFNRRGNLSSHARILFKKVFAIVLKTRASFVHRTEIVDLIEIG
jgi:hypothetical protein